MVRVVIDTRQMSLRLAERCVEAITCDGFVLYGETRDELVSGKLDADEADEIMAIGSRFGAKMKVL